MRTYFNIVLAGMCCLLMTACDEHYSITGEAYIPTLEDHCLTLRVRNGERWDVLDTLKVVHRRFHAEGVADSARVAVIFWGESPLTPIVLESGKVNVTLRPGKFSVEGTPLNNKLYGFIFKQQCTIYKYKGQDLFNALSAQWDAFVLRNSKNCVGKHMKELKAICTRNKAMDDVSMSLMNPVRAEIH
ncbi:MAG TPA: DUF4369 domain-containing protein [Bacteroidaceae bacterium]|nr:DUF4369 domain-containing protein [Bacteroidaceae bacterium]